MSQQQITQGCGHCPHCNEDEGVFLEGWEEFWVCRDCRTRHDAQTSKCRRCNGARVEHRTWHIGPICACLACNRTYGPITGVFSVPSSSDVKRLEQHLINRALKRS